MKVRVISGAACAILMFLLVWVGDPILSIVLSLVGAKAYHEIATATGVHADKKKLNVFSITSILFTLIFYCQIYFFGDFQISMIIMVVLFVLHMFFYVITYPKYSAPQVISSFFSFAYGPVLLSFIVLTRGLSNSLDTANHNVGFFASWMIFICAWVCDTCAYFVGVLFGKHKAFPVLSPKKTIEGCAGGVIGAALVGGIYGYVLYALCEFPFQFVPGFAIIGGLGSFVGMTGDLAASAIKRHFEIKDYGKIIPGHGGIMDRFDSITFTAPVVYVICVVLFKLIAA